MANAFLIEGDDGLILIDAGFSAKEAAVFGAIDGIGRSADELRHLVFTHGHPDHIGSAAAIVRKTSARADAALLAAMNMAEREAFRAVAAFYPWCGDVSHAGIVWKSAVAVFSAEKHDWTPASLCEQVAQRDRPTGERFELTVYPGAYHAFDQQLPKRTTFGHVLAYDKEAADDSRRKMVAFFLLALKHGRFPIP